MKVFEYVMAVAVSVSGFAQQGSRQEPLAVPSLADVHPVAACSSDRMSDIVPCMQGFVNQGSLIGLVTLVDRKGTVQIDAVGRYRRDSIFQIMSMTKPFVSVLILQLVEEGKIPSIDARVSELPGFKDFPYREVTIKELLTHTSGIWPKRVEKGQRLGVAPFLTNAFDREPGITVRDKTLEFVASHYANPELYPLQPKEAIYSNIGFTFLGRIAEKLSGMR